MPETKSPMQGCEDNIKVKRKEMGYQNEDWIRIAQNRIFWTRRSAFTFHIRRESPWLL